MPRILSGGLSAVKSVHFAFLGMLSCISHFEQRKEILETL